MEVYPSTAWVKASNPVALVTLFGEDTVNDASTIATSGISTVPFNNILIVVFVSVIMVNCVASDPVPAVVGIATIGGSGFVISFPM